MSTELLLDSPPEKHAAIRRQRNGNRVRYAAAANELQQFLTRTGAWAVQNAARVAKVYLVADADLNLYVVAKSATYDFELRKSLTELIVAFKDDGYPASGSIVPDGTPAELQAFFDPTRAFTLSPK